MIGYIHRIAPGVIALALAAGCATKASGPGDDQAPQVRTLADLPLLPAENGVRTFGAGPIQGRLDASGIWTLRGEIGHRRLRCSTYELGLIAGRGDASCSRVEWVTEADFATRLTHCNAATRVHSASGALGLQGPALASINCVRILTRCTGAC